MRRNGINNPYLAEFEASSKHHGGWSNPDRDRLVVKYSWAIPTDDAIMTLVKYSPIVEMGAGTGYWASLVRQAGGNIVPIDQRPPSARVKNEWQHDRTWVPVLPGGPGLLRGCSDRSLFLCWPPYDKPMAADCLDAWAGKYLIYVGEGRGGCNANDRFFNILSNDFEEVEYVSLPNWPRIHDDLVVYRRMGR